MFRRKLKLMFLFATVVLCGLATKSHGGCLPSFSKDQGKGWLGVRVKEVPYKYQRRYNLKHYEGVYVTHVAPDSPAEQAGIKRRDIITKFNGTRIKGSHHLRRLVHCSEIGETVELEILHAGKTKTLKVTIGKRPECEEEYFFRYPFWGGFFFYYGGIPYLGVSLQDLNEDLAKYFGVSEDAGALVLEVEEDSPADEAGLKAGDIIAEIDGEKIHRSKDVTRILKDYRPGDEIEMKVYRDHKLKTLTVELGNEYFPNYQRYRKHPWKFYFTPPYFDFERDHHFHFYWPERHEYIWLKSQPWHKRLRYQVENMLWTLKLRWRLLRFRLQREYKRLITQISEFVHHEKLSQVIENSNC